MLKSVLNKFAANEKVTSDMIMGDIIRLHPEVVDTLIRACTAWAARLPSRKAWQTPASSMASTRKLSPKPSTSLSKQTNSKGRISL